MVNIVGREMCATFNCKISVNSQKVECIINYIKHVIT